MSGERRQSWVACWTDGPRVLPREEVRECDGNPMEDVEDSGERKKASWTNDRRDRNRTMNTETGNYLCLADGRVASAGRPATSISYSASCGTPFIGSRRRWSCGCGSLPLARGYDENAIKNGLDAEQRRKCGAGPCEEDSLAIATFITQHTPEVRTALHPPVWMSGSECKGSIRETVL